MVRTTLIVLLILSGSASAQSASLLIEREERALAETLGKNDTSVLDRVFADDCVWILPNGAVLNKTEAHKAILSDQPYSALRSSAVSVRVFGKIAVAHGTDTWRRGHATGTFVWSSTWLFRRGRWQIVQVQDMERSE